MWKPYMPKTYKQVNAHGIIGGDLVRPLRLMLTVASISLVCILCCGLVSALDADEASVTLFWSSQTVYQGDTITVRITFKSNSADQLNIYRIGLHFDWMSSNEFYTSDLSANPVIIPSSGSYMFGPIAIQIPSNVSAGSYSYFVGVDGMQESSSFSWDSPASTIQIHAANEKVYAIFMSQVKSRLDEATNASYESAEAQSLLQQAQSEYNNATSLVNAGNWQEALSHLQNASDLLDQADEKEQRSGEQRAGLQTLLFYVAIIAIAVIIAVSIIVVVVRKKRKQADAGADQPLETIEEQSEEQS
jgi:hypothetical protein